MARVAIVARVALLSIAALVVCGLLFEGCSVLFAQAGESTHSMGMDMVMVFQIHVHQSSQAAET